MKKLKKLAIKKVTLRDLDAPQLDLIAGGATATCDGNKTCPVTGCNNTVCQGSVCKVC
jgi:natural product precursor